MTADAQKRYESFIDYNKHNSCDTKSTIISYNNQLNACIYVANDRRTMYLIPIKILISDVYNDMVHINSASILKNWHGWENAETETDMYPDDYFDAPEAKYIIDVTNDYHNDSVTNIYKKYANRLIA